MNININRQSETRVYEVDVIGSAKSCLSGSEIGGLLIGKIIGIASQRNK